MDVIATRSSRRRRRLFLPSAYEGAPLLDATAVQFVYRLDHVRMAGAGKVQTLFREPCKRT